VTTATRGHEPWKGSAYHTAQHRVLLLGEAHYLTDFADDSPSLTRDIVRDVRDGERRLPFYSKAAALVGGAEADSPEGRAAVWDRLAFFNYIPGVVDHVSNTVPTTEMWAAAIPRLFTLLAELAPTHVLSLGQRQWNHIAFPAGWSTVAVQGNPDAQVRRWMAPDGHTMIATWVNHPSSPGFSTAKWRGRVRALLATSPS